MRTFDIRRHRPIAVLLLLNQLGCYGWARQPESTELLLQNRHPRTIRLHRSDGTVTVIGSPVLVEDSIVGTWQGGAGPEMRSAVPAAHLRAAAVELTDGTSVDLQAPIVRHDSLVGFLNDPDSDPAAVAIGDVERARLGLADGHRVMLRSVVVAGDSLVGVTRPVLGGRGSDALRIAVPVTDARWSEVRKMTGGGKAALVIVGLTAALTAWYAIAVAGDTTCRYGLCPAGR